jgi:hypothetical protein
VGQFWTPIPAKGGSLLHADLHRGDFGQIQGAYSSVFSFTESAEATWESEHSGIEYFLLQSQQ